MHQFHVVLALVLPGTAVSPRHDEHENDDGGEADHKADWVRVGVPNAVNLYSYIQLRLIS